MSKIDDFRVGQMVASREFPDDKGQVQKIDEEEHLVYVRFPTSRGSDVDSLDPGDLIPLETIE